MIMIQCLPKRQTNKKQREKWNSLQFSNKEKMFCVVCRKHQERLKKMSGFTKTFIKGSNNFKTSGLSNYDKMPMAGSIL